MNLYNLCVYIYPFISNYVWWLFFFSRRFHNHDAFFQIFFSIQHPRRTDSQPASSLDLSSSTSRERSWPRSWSQRFSLLLPFFKAASRRRWSSMVEDFWLDNSLRGSIRRKWVLSTCSTNISWDTSYIYIYIHNYIHISCHGMSCHGVCVYACMRVCR